MPKRELAAFGAAVRKRRAQVGLSQEKLAERSGLHRTYVSGVERGERNLGLLNVYRLARALGVSGSELLSAAETPSRRAVIQADVAFCQRDSPGKVHLFWRLNARVRLRNPRAGGPRTLRKKRP